MLIQRWEMSDRSEIWVWLRTFWTTDVVWLQQHTRVVVAFSLRFVMLLLKDRFKSLWRQLLVSDRSTFLWSCCSKDPDISDCWVKSVPLYRENGLNRLINWLASKSFNGFWLVGKYFYDPLFLSLAFVSEVDILELVEISVRFCHINGDCQNEHFQLGN